MAFSEKTKDEIFENSDGKCQCTRQHKGQQAPHHGGRCSSKFLSRKDWHAHHIVSEKSDGPDTASNGEALCLKCHYLTKTYGDS